MVIRKPVFVVGVARSGTSLIQSMLASHSELAFPPETSFLRRYVARRRLESVHRREGWEGVRLTLAADSRMARVEDTWREVIDDVERGGRHISDVSVYERLLVCHARALGKCRVGDKDPRLIEFLPLLQRLWPDAFVIHVIRDPRDVVASKKNASWSRHRPAWLHVLANSVQFAVGRATGRRLFGSQYIELGYESVLAHPVESLMALCHRLDIDFEPAMLAFSDEARRLVSKDEESWKRETLGPLLARNTGRGLAELSAWEVALTEMACCQTLRACGYRVSERRREIRWFRRPWLYVVAAALAVGRVAYRLSLAVNQSYLRRAASVSPRDGMLEDGT